jgi:hypothetical protein
VWVIGIAVPAAARHTGRQRLGTIGKGEVGGIDQRSALTDLLQQPYQTLRLGDVLAADFSTWVLALMALP